MTLPHAPAKLTDAQRIAALEKLLRSRVGSRCALVASQIRFFYKAELLLEKLRAKKSLAASAR